MSMQKPWLKFWPSHVPQTINFPETPVGEMLRRTAKQFPNKTAIIYFGTRISFAELDTLSDQFASGLQSLGLNKGDRVGLLLPNIPQFVIAYYGSLKAGAIVIAISPLYKERELGFILSDSGAEILVCYDRLYPLVQKVKAQSKLRLVVSTSVRDFLPPILRILSPLKGVKSYPCPGATDFMDLMKKHQPNPRPVEISAKKDVALLQYTGGTTGVPKGAMITHHNLVVNCVQVASWLPIKPGVDVHLSVLPFFHIYGMTVTMNSPIYSGTTMVLLPDPRDAHAILKAIEKYKPTIFCGVPTMYVNLINRPDIKKYNLSSIKTCFSGAAPLPLEVQRKFEQLSGGRLVEGYGLTETSPVSHVNPLDDPAKNRPGSIGIPVSDTSAKIVDLETGEKDLPSGEVGELAIKGPQVTMGYWNRPEDTKRGLRDGWFFTGDIAKMDEDGYFYIVDRKKDMIDVSGLKVWPREVEEVLYEHPAIKEAAVVGIPDTKRGETVKAFVSLKDEYEGKVQQEDIIKFCKDKIASYKAPTVVEFRKDLPKTPIGKILRRELRETQAA